MTLALSSGDVRRLEAALGTLVTPFAYPDLAAWSAAATHQCADFLGADQALFGMMTVDRMVIVAHGARSEEAARSYMTDYWRHDFVLTERRFQLGRETYHRDMLYRPGERRRCMVYNEWSAPNRLCDTIGMSVEAANPMLAGIHFYHDREAGDFRERGVELLRLLLPAFKAGIHAWLSLAERRTAFVSTLDGAGAGALVTDLAGQILEETPALARTLGLEPERARVRHALLQAAAGVGAIVARRPHKSATIDLAARLVARELRTAHARYRVIATYVPEGTVAPGGAVAAVLTRQTPQEASDVSLRERFNLTAREIQVARLLAKGHRNAEIAAALGTSAHTALHHTERVLHKLGVHSRAAVACALQNS
jgi:DNA-binding CsgD family transcriptional regulator/PAS domain-containing protein